MRRWLLTGTLASSALAALVLAPRLSGWGGGPEALVVVAPDPVAASDWTAGPLAFSARLDQTTLLSGSNDPRYVVLTVKAPDDSRKDRRLPLDLALVVDTSGSMGSGEKIQQAREAARKVVEALGPEDRFSLVSFDDSAHVLLPAQAYDGDRDRLLDVVATLDDHGGTNLYEGLATGYGQLGDGERHRRLLLISDGNATVGITENEAFRSMVRDYASRGVTVSALGLGADFNEVLLEGLADLGGGNYAYVQESGELSAATEREFQSATRTVAQDVAVSLTLPEGVRVTTVHGWSYTERGSTVTVPVGQLSAGQERKIVFEVDASSIGGGLTGEGSVHVADAALTYHVVGDDATYGARVGVDALLTADFDAARASRDEAVNVAVARARAGTYSARAAEATRSGNVAEAKALRRTGEDVLTEQKSRLQQVINSVDGGYSHLSTLEGDLEQQQQIAELQERGLATQSAKAASAAGRGMSR